jgi:hypothetical protein
MKRTCDAPSSCSTMPASWRSLTVVEVMPYEIADRGPGGGLQPEVLRVRRAALACAPALR